MYIFFQHKFITVFSRSSLIHSVLIWNTNIITLCDSVISVHFVDRISIGVAEVWSQCIWRKDWRVYVVLVQGAGSGSFCLDFMHSWYLLFMGMVARVFILYLLIQNQNAQFAVAFCYIPCCYKVDTLYKQYTFLWPYLVGFCWPSVLMVLEMSPLCFQLQNVKS